MQSKEKKEVITVLLAMAPVNKWEQTSEPSLLHAQLSSLSVS